MWEKIDMKTYNEHNSIIKMFLPVLLQIITIKSIKGCPFVSSP